MQMWFIFHLGGLVKDKSKIQFEENFINSKNIEFNKEQELDDFII